MLVYQTDFAGLLTGTALADESPLEPGVYLLPARCVKTPPPAEFKANQWPRWNGSSWDLVTKPKLKTGKIDPVEKLERFLADNPEVAALLNKKKKKTKGVV